MLGCSSRGGFHFALEPFDRRVVLHGGGYRHHLEHNALHPPMLGLVDLAHAAGADFGQQHVVAHDQPAPATGEQILRCLKLRQLPGRDEGLPKTVAFFRTTFGRKPGPQRFHFLGGQTPEATSTLPNWSIDMAEMHPRRI